MEQNKTPTKNEACNCDKKAQSEIKALKEQVEKLKQENESLKQFIGVTL